MPWPIEAEDRDRPDVRRENQLPLGRRRSVAARARRRAPDGWRIGLGRENSRRNNPALDFSAPSSLDVISLPTACLARAYIVAEPWRAMARRASYWVMTPEETRARLLYRDGLMLVIDKPAGVAVHRGPRAG